MPDPGSSPETPFADLVSRYLDGTASAVQRQALTQAILSDAERGREFASQARFESMLRKACRRDAKALLEFAALEAASDDSADATNVGARSDVGLVPASAAVVAAGAPPSRRPTRWRTAAAPWLRVAAVFLALAGSAALWFTQDSHPQGQPAPQVASATPAILQVHSVSEDEMILLAPRQQEVSASTSSGRQHAAEDPKMLTLAERLEDFYLPSVSLRQVRAQDAADWLTAQLRQHNYARRPDLNRLTLRLPPSVASRLVTLESGPISFKRAVEIVSTLAGGEATIGQEGIQIVERATPAEENTPAWQTSPLGKEEARQQAAALGITIDDTMLKEEAGGGTSLCLPADQQRALGMLADAQQRLESLAPLSFMPLVVPADTAGAQRVLSASAIESIRQQLGSANTVPLPTITVPFGGSSQSTSLLNGSGETAITVKVTPVGEMNQVTIQPATTTPTATPATNLLADNSAPTAPPRVDAVLDTNQGVVTNIDGGTQLYTAEGIPIPPGYEWLYGLAAAAPPEDPYATTLVLVPVP